MSRELHHRQGTASTCGPHTARLVGTHTRSHGWGEKASPAGGWQAANWPCAAGEGVRRAEGRRGRSTSSIVQWRALQ